MVVQSKSKLHSPDRSYTAACILMCIVPVATFVSAVLSVLFFPVPWCYAAIQVFGAVFLLLGSLCAYRKFGCRIGRNSDVACSFLGGVCMFCYFPGALLVSISVGAMFPASQGMEAVQADGSVMSFGFVVSWVLLVFLPAVTEEVLCRGILFTAFRKYGAIFACLSSALCFAAMHGSIQQAAYAFYFGLVLALLRDASGSVVPCMVCHGLFNTVGVLQAALPGYFSSAESVTGIFGTYGGLVLLSVVGAVIGMFVLKACRRRSYHDDIDSDRLPVRAVVLAGTSFLCNAAANVLISML